VWWGCWQSEAYHVYQNLFRSFSSLRRTFDVFVSWFKNTFTGGNSRWQQKDICSNVHTDILILCIKGTAKMYRL